MLSDLKAGLLELTSKYPGSGISFAVGAAQAQEQIPILCRTIDDAIMALKTGFAPHGNPITKNLITDAFKRRVPEIRKPDFIGLMTALLNREGIQQL